MTSTASTAKYTVVGYPGCPQRPIECSTLRQARIQRDLNGGVIVNAKGERVF